jgi:signal transduction histidine kinase/streptogramin lyase
MSRYAWLLLAIFSFTIRVSGSNNFSEGIKFDHINKNTGLSHSTVYAVVQDKYGFIWIGTADGLNRFDGYTVKKYYYDPENHNSLSNNRIYKLLITRDGELWIGTLNGGLNKYRYNTDDFISFTSNKADTNTISDDRIMGLWEDGAGLLWVGTAEGGLNSFDRSTGKFRRYTNNPSDPDSYGYKTAISMTADYKGRMYVALNDLGMDMFDQATGKFEHFRQNKSDKNSLINDGVNHLMTDKRGMIWISTNDGISLYNPRTEIFENFRIPAIKESLRPNEIYESYEDTDGNIWFCTYGGLSVITSENYEKRIFKTFINNPLDPSSISSDLVRCIYEDRNGILWAGNFSKGIDRFSRNKSKFITIRNKPENPSSLTNNIVRCFAEDKAGNIWVGTYGGGINCLNTESGIISNSSIPALKKGIMKPDLVNSLCTDKDGNVWIGTWGFGLYKLDISNKTWKIYKNIPGDSTSLSNDAIRSLMCSRDGMLWIATSGGGLNQFDPNTGKFHWFLNNKNDKKTISDNRVMGLFEDHEGYIWTGSSGNGLNRLNRKTGEFENFRNDPGNENSLVSNRVHCIYESRYDSSIWVGTGNGLCRLNKTDNTFKRFTKKEGFTGDVIYGILEDKNGFFWISTTDGLVRFDQVEERVLRVYNEADGLQSNEYSEGGYFLSSDGIMYFGGSNGMSLFNPAEVVVSNLTPETYIVDFQLFNQSISIDSNNVLEKNIILTDKINLRYSDYVFSFEFAALSYINPEQNQYMYMMENFDREWVLTSAKRRFVTYTNLKPGTYRFMVKASNSDGIWNDNAKSVEIVISPPWYGTIAFRISAIFFVVAFLALAYNLRVRNLNNKRKALQIAVKEKTLEVMSQKEELEYINRELSESNLELHNQHEKLESALEALKSAQNQLIQSEKMASLGVLAAGVAHEINNPLNFIRGGVMGLDTYFSDNLKDHREEVEPLLKGIQEGVTRAANIVTSLNHYSRQDSLPRENCNIHTIIDNCLVILQNQIKNRIEVRKNYFEGSLTFSCKESKMHQAILNILANAAQAIEKKGIITVSTSVDNGIMVLSVEDNGCGMSEETLQKIFDPFYTTKKPGEGTGLGMSITYSIINEHNGTVEFKSAQGVGTTAIIRVPLSQ